MTRRFENKIAWITGGGTGIGKALALELAQQGAAVAVSGRREDRLVATVGEIEAAGGQGLAVTCDVTDEAQIAAAVSKVVDHFGRLDVVIANAGYGVAGKVEKITSEQWRRQLEVNVVGVATTARLAIPHLRVTSGRLVLVGSVLAYFAMRNNAPYCASKYAVRAIGEALSLELHGSGVSCTTVHPGFVESEIGQVDNEGVFHADQQDKRPKKLMWPADKAARAMVNAIYKRKRTWVMAWYGKAGTWLSRYSPGLMHFAQTRQ